MAFNNFAFELAETLSGALPSTDEVSVTTWHGLREAFMGSLKKIQLAVAHKVPRTSPWLLFLSLFGKYFEPSRVLQLHLGSVRQHCIQVILLWLRFSQLISRILATDLSNLSLCWVDKCGDTQSSATNISIHDCSTSYCSCTSLPPFTLSLPHLYYTWATLGTCSVCDGCVADQLHLMCVCYSVRKCVCYGAAMWGLWFASCISSNKIAHVK